MEARTHRSASPSRWLLVAFAVTTMALLPRPSEAIEGCVMLNPLGWMGTDHEHPGGMSGITGTTCQYEARLSGDIFAVGLDWRVTIWRCPEGSVPDCEPWPTDPDMERIVFEGEAPAVQVGVIRPYDLVRCEVRAPGTFLACGNGTTP